MSEPIQISLESENVATREVLEVTHKRYKPIGFHVQQLLNAETEKLRKENEELKARMQELLDYQQDAGIERDLNT